LNTFLALLFIIALEMKKMSQYIIGEKHHKEELTIHNYCG